MFLICLHKNNVEYHCSQIRTLTILFCSSWDGDGILMGSIPRPVECIYVGMSLAES